VCGRSTQSSFRRHLLGVSSAFSLTMTCTTQERNPPDLNKSYREKRNFDDDPPTCSGRSATMSHAARDADVAAVVATVVSSLRASSTSRSSDVDAALSQYCVHHRPAVDDQTARCCRTLSISIAKAKSPSIVVGLPRSEPGRRQREARRAARTRRVSIALLPARWLMRSLWRAGDKQRALLGHCSTNLVAKSAVYTNLTGRVGNQHSYFATADAAVVCFAVHGDGEWLSTSSRRRPTAVRADSATIREAITCCRDRQ
jgi:hypothetical protein